MCIKCLSWQVPGISWILTVLLNAQCYGLNCAPSKTKSLLLVPVNMTLFGNGVFADDEVKMGSGRVGHREHAV